MNRSVACEAASGSLLVMTAIGGASREDQRSALWEQCIISLQYTRQEPCAQLAWANATNYRSRVIEITHNAGDDTQASF